MKDQTQVRINPLSDASKYRLKSVGIGIIAGVSLLSVYLIILSLANSFSHAIDQFIALWYWMTPLIIGFGIQVGLYFYARTLAKINSATTQITATSGVSSASMITCCVHHVSDVLPVLGLTAITPFIDTYQTAFLITGIVSNIFGINMMLYHLQKHSSAKNYLFSWMNRVDLKSILYANAIVGGIIIITAFMVYT